ncbi:glycosyltransferase family 4 protein [Lysobacter panacisoli]|uniref:Glycosyltransferase family 1 protein n=1 Tax=Lysobacter panacisoli TaxID=1255263 RepID=A0ABP9L411_9GAMM|nr:glycosyltransferase family 4 protein [Lysobacter panacisoli]
MKLVLVNYEYPPLGGGAGNATAYLARALHALGHRVTVVTGAYRELAGETSDEGVSLLRLRSRRARVDRASLVEMASYVWRACWVVPRLARRIEADGCIVFFSVPCGPIGWLTKLLSGTPYVVALRGGDVPGTEAGLTSIQRFITPARRMVLRGASAVTANSHGLAALSLAADPIAVQVIANGVDTTFFHPPAVPPADEVVRLLFAGRFTEQKNLSVLIRAFESARSQTPSLHLTMVGDGPLRDSLQREARELGVDSAITWRGWLTKPELGALYRESHVFVNPSLYEGMPNTVLEAMASGLPVIASGVAGNDELVKHEQTGLLFDLAEPQALVAAISRLAADARTREVLGSAARQSMLDGYSWEATARRYAEYFESGDHR